MREKCDYCELVLDSAECPGYEAHCRENKHCTTTDVTCNADKNMNDHSPECCICGEVI